MSAADEISAQRDSRHLSAPGMILAQGNRQLRRHDDGSGVHRPALERIVEILAVCRGAVDERRSRAVQRPLMADRRAGTAAFPALYGGDDVSALPRRDAKAGDVGE